MKFRIRYKTVTKVLSVPDGQDHSLEHIKLCIRQQLADDLQIPSSSSFDLSLNGTTSIGPDSLCLSNAGVVSGDLIKIILSSEACPGSQHSQPSTSVESMTGVEDDLSTLEVATTSAQQPPVDSPRGGAVLLQDYHDNQPLPVMLRTLFELPAVTNKFHAICVLFHNLMLESGFFLRPSSHSSSEVISAALTSPVFTVEYNHPAAQSLVAVVTCNTLGPFVLVNGLVRPCVNTEEQVLTVQVKVDEFVKSFDSTAKEDGKKVYKHLGKLARLFKESIAHKALNSMREELQLPPLHGILSLFPELLIRILSNVDAQALCAIAQTCRTLRDVSSDDLLWRPLCKRKFTSGPVNRAWSWKEFYKRQHLQQQQAERERLEREREFLQQPPFNPYPDTPVMLPQPGQPLGMLGGDYDLDPSFPYGPFGRGRGGVPNPLHPRGPRLPGSGNPLPGSRYDPMNPFGGRFRPGRGGGMMDDDSSLGMPKLPSRQRRGFGGSGGGFGGGFM